VLLMVMLLAACGKPKSLIYKDVKNFRLHSIKLTEPIFAADVRFYNPNGYPLVLKHADVDVYINNKYTGKVTLDSTITIPRKDTFLLPVTINVALNGAFNNALQLLMKKEVLIKLQGSARAGRGITLVNIPINFEGKSELSLY
jgi:LEA14-like dessication related protein